MAKKVFLPPSNQYDNRYAAGNTTYPVAKGMTVNSATAYGGSVDMASLITTDTIVFATWMPVSD